MKKIDSILEKIILLCKILLILIGASMSILTFGNAIARKLGTSALIWADEINRFSFIYMTYFGMVVGAYYGRHAMVDLLLDKLSHIPRTLITILGNLFIIGFLVILTYGGIQMMSFAGLTKSSVLHIPLSYIYIGLPIGSVFTIIVYFVHTIDSVIHLKER